MLSTEFKAVNALLTPAQRKRVVELQLQRLGPAAVFVPQVVRALQLSDQQKASIEKVYKASSPERREIFMQLFIQLNSEGKREAAMKRLVELNQTTMSEITQILNDRQKKEFQEIGGE